MDFFIRPLEPKDSCAINELRRMPGVFENILGVPSERLKFSSDYIESLTHNDHQFVAVVKKDDKEIVVGTAGLAVSPRNRLRHSGIIGIMIHKDYQNKGIGSALMATLIDIADNWLMLVRLELVVYADNDRAIHLYEKFGFEKEGLKKLSSIRNGKYADEYIMARISLSKAL